MRNDYDKFIERDTEILVIGPDNHQAFKEYWAKNDLPFPGLADPKHHVARAYHQQVKILSLGRMPALVVVDKLSMVRYVHYGQSMKDIPSNEDVWAVLDGLD